jgi:hypothetical protein
MMRTQIWPNAACIAVVSGLVLAIAATAGPPAPPKPAAQNEIGERRPTGRSVTISPGIQTLASASTDIVIADVVETNPTKAVEGARDTVKLKVIRTLLGRPAAGDTIGVYYHLLWSDEKREILESPKFIKGKRYVIFLGSHLSRRPDGERIEYELTDRWLSVLPDHVDLVEEVAAAIRVSHGDSRGEWSSTDGSIAGLQGRLVAYRAESVKSSTPIITIYLELRNTSGGNNSTEFLLDGAKTDWIVSDTTGKATAPISPPGIWGSTDKPRKLILDSQEGGRLLLTIGEGAVTPGRAGHLELATEEVWEFAQGDKGVHFLTGKITIASSGQPGQWYGTLNLPKVRIPPR